jgi:hypothetical protein
MSEERNQEELIRKINQLTNEFDETMDARPVTNPNSQTVEEWDWDQLKKVTRKTLPEVSG